jgi:hypothetical protein
MMKPGPLLALLLAAHLAAAAAQDPGWPRELSRAGAHMTYYEPQVDSWKDFTDLEFRFAFELKPPQGSPAVGIGVVRAHTDVDVDRRTAVMSNLQVQSTRFPGADEQQARRLDALFRDFVAAQGGIVIALDRLVAATAQAQAPKGVPLKNDPPAIFVSYRPAILLQTDGPPQYARAGQDPGVEYVVNTNWPLFRQSAGGRYYLFNGVRWATATALQGPWTDVMAVPAEILKVLQDPRWADLKKASASATRPGSSPSVFYSSVPAELIEFSGRPSYARIPGTELVYAKNTDADLFVYTRTNAWYYLAAGRWFRAASLDGPWTFATPDLPPDFAAIPPDSPAARVLASVPGTEAAKDAVLLAQIPTRALVDPRAAEKQARAEYDGPPQFRPIEGTGMHYAVNTPDRVIQVNNQYYLLEQGVWFVASSPAGPWTTAPSVPAVIYTIPPSSPVYNVTYVTQTTTTTGYVASSYTAGYFGAFVLGAAFGSVLCDGSGYWYPPYYHYPPHGYPVYRPYPATYGVGSLYNPYTGAYGVSRGAYGPRGGATGAAAYNPYTGTYARAGSAYGPYGSRAAGAAYNPWTGAYARAGAASGPYGSTAYAAARNPATGAAAATRQGAGVYGQWGSSVVQRGGQGAVTRHASGASGSVAAVATTGGARAVAGAGAQGRGGAVATAGGDLYAGRDGNVYRRSGGQWQHYQDGQWNSTAAGARGQDLRGSSGTQGRTSAGGPGTRTAGQGAAVPQHVNRDWQARQRGSMQAQRFNSFQRSGSVGAGRSFGGGGRGVRGGRR